MPSVAGVTDLTVVGSGGFATVFRGYQERFDRWVALKVLRVDPMDGAARRRFARECAAMGRLSSHPNVVTVYDSGILDDGRPYLVAEFCEGGSYAERLTAQGPLPPVEALDVAARLAAVLADAHDTGILHRDVKPGNVLIRRGNEPALADFGLSLIPDRDASRGLEAFSLGYAAPETLTDGAFSTASDAYALGATIHALLTARPPFPVQPGEGFMPYLLRITRDPVPPLGIPVPASVEALIGELLAKTPEQRPGPREVAERLATAGRVAAGGSPRDTVQDPSAVTTTPPAPLPPTLRPTASPPAAAPPAAAPPPAAAAAVAAAAAAAQGRPSGTDPLTAATHVGPAHPAPAQVPPPTPAPSDPGPQAGPLVQWPPVALTPPSPPDPGHPSDAVTHVRAGSPTASRRSGPLRRWLGGTAATVVVVVAVAVGGSALGWWGPGQDAGRMPGRTPSLPASAAGTATAGTTTTATGAGLIAVDPPQDLGKTVVLTWTGPAQWDYAVVIAEQGTAGQRIKVTYHEHTATVPVDPARSYCFVVQGTDGRTRVDSPAISVRHARCTM
jgi:serine/threonine-protein kinase PknK